VFESESSRSTKPSQSSKLSQKKKDQLHIKVDLQSKLEKLQQQLEVLREQSKKSGKQNKENIAQH
jgi:hypothetical protein